MKPDFTKQSHLHALTLSPLFGSPPPRPPPRDYSSNAIFPLYVNVYYFSRYIRSPPPFRAPPAPPPCSCIVPSTPHRHLHNWTFDWTLRPPLRSHVGSVWNPKHNFMAKMTRGGNAERKQNCLFWLKVQLNNAVWWPLSQFLSGGLGRPLKWANSISFNVNRY